MTLQKIKLVLPVWYALNCNGQRKHTRRNELEQRAITPSKLKVTFRNL